VKMGNQFGPECRFESDTSLKFIVNSLASNAMLQNRATHTHDYWFE